MFKYGINLERTVASNMFKKFYYIMNKVWNPKLPKAKKECYILDQEV
jgi:hypothetical protein